jgi:hypothetical protein
MGVSSVCCNFGDVLFSGLTIVGFFFQSSIFSGIWPGFREYGSLHHGRERKGRAKLQNNAFLLHSLFQPGIIPFSP